MRKFEQLTAGPACVRMLRVHRKNFRIAPTASSPLDMLAKRQLKYDSHETILLLMPFIVWSALVGSAHDMHAGQSVRSMCIINIMSIIVYVRACRWPACGHQL